MTEPLEINTLSTGTRFEDALPTAVRWSHALVAPRLYPGDLVVDATAGNGHDTVFLAQRVRPGGRVFAFDVQEAALERTRARISELQAVPDDMSAVTLIHAGHERMEEHLPPDVRGRIRAIMFNLGWLPGSDKACITCTETTLAALNMAVGWLAENGIMTVVCYPGHDGGRIEALTVERWTTELPADCFEAQKIAFLNLDGAPPVCFVLRKRARAPRRSCG